MEAKHFMSISFLVPMNSQGTTCEILFFFYCFDDSPVVACTAGVFWMGETLFRVRNIVVAATFDFMTVEGWGE